MRPWWAACEWVQVDVRPGENFSRMCPSERTPLSVVIFRGGVRDAAWGGGGVVRSDLIGCSGSGHE